MRRAVAILTRNGHAEAHRYGWSFFSQCVEELSGEPEKEPMGDPLEKLHKPIGG